MEYQDASAYPQDSTDHAVYSSEGADAEYGQQQQEEYAYSGDGDPDTNAYSYYDVYDYSADQQADGAAAYSDGGGYGEDVYAYDPETGAYYSDGTAPMAADDGEPLAELAVDAQREYYQDASYNYYGSYQWDEATGQYTSAFEGEEEEGGGDEDGEYTGVPPSPFKDEAYWEQELYNQQSNETNDAVPESEASLESAVSTPAVPTASINTPEAESAASHETPKSSSARSKVATPSSSKKKVRH